MNPLGIEGARNEGHSGFGRFVKPSYLHDHDFVLARGVRLQANGANAFERFVEGEGDQQLSQTQRPQRRRARRGGPGPRDTPREGEEWMLVRRYNPQRGGRGGGRGNRGAGGRQNRAPRDDSSQQQQ